MTAALPRPSDHCFDWGRLWIALDLIFGELEQEADRPIRDRLNEVLRQWYWRHHPKPPH